MRCLEQQVHGHTPQLPLCSAVLGVVEEGNTEVQGAELSGAVSAIEFVCLSSGLDDLQPPGQLQFLCPLPGFTLTLTVPSKTPKALLAWPPVLFLFVGCSMSMQRGNKLIRMTRSVSSLPLALLGGPLVQLLM